MSTIDRLRLGVVQYDQGRQPIVFGANRMRFAAIICLIGCKDGETGAGIVWSTLIDELRYLTGVKVEVSNAVIGATADAPESVAASIDGEGRRLGISRVVAAVQFALFDLAAKRRGATVHAMLGAKRSSLPAYIISADEFGFTEDAEYVALAARYAASEFSACKLHLTGDARRDISLCEAIRRTVGPDFGLMLDPAGRYSRLEALRVGRAIEQLEFVRFEDPLSPDEVEGYGWLSKHLAVPLVGNESLRWSRRDCDALARSGQLQGFRFDPGRGGMVSAFEMRSMAEAAGAELDFAAFAPKGGVAPCLALALSSAATRWFEFHEAAALDEVPGVNSGIVFRNGAAHPVEQPGFGFDVNWNELDRYCAWAN